jgi:hypothetical protein
MCSARRRGGRVGLGVRLALEYPSIVLDEIEDPLESSDRVGWSENAKTHA